MKKDLEYVCNYFKSVIIPHIPDDFTVIESFRHNLTDEEIRKGITAFREFLYDLFDKLIDNKDKIDVEIGSKYETCKSIDAIRICFPVIFDLSIILFSLGIYGRLEMEKNEETIPIPYTKMKLSINSKDLLTVICQKTENYTSLVKMSGERRLEMFRLLSDVGLRFTGADFTAEVNFSKSGIFHVTSEKNDFFAVGLKLIAEAAANHKDYYYIMNTFFPVLLRCNYHPLANAAPKKLYVYINELANSQPPEVKEWIENIDALLTRKGYKNINHGGGEFTYTLKNVREMILRIHMGIEGCFMLPGVKSIADPNRLFDLLSEKSMDIIKSSRRCKVCASGKRKTGQCGNICKFTHNGEEYLRCADKPSIDLNDADNREAIKKWLEMELA